MKTEISKSRAIELFEKRRKKKIAFKRLEKKVIKAIKAEQTKLSRHLLIDKSGYVVRRGKDLSPGCHSCQKGKWCVMHMNTACNLNCSFCLNFNEYEKTRELYDGEGLMCAGVVFNDFEEWKFQFDQVKSQYSGFAWIGGEPLLVWSKIKPLLQYCKKTYPKYWNWMYTNGTLLTVKKMKEMRKSGLDELRFNLAATNFDSRVIENLREASKIFKWTCIEIPMLTQTYKGLMRNIKPILESGVKQFNLAEFMVGPNQFSEQIREEGKMYKFKNMITSPVVSRRLTYKVIARAVKENWPVTINDCSNEYKYYKNTKNHLIKRFFDPSRANPWKSNLSIDAIEDWNSLIEDGCDFSFSYDKYFGKERRL